MVILEIRNLVSNIYTRNLSNMSKRSSDDTKDIPSKIPKKGHWSQGLLQSVEDPDLLVSSDDYVYVIKDKYPKAQYHYLIISKKDISSLNKVNKKDLNLLEHMHKTAEELVKEKKHNFKIGYHAEPSMTRLHLHVISDDMNSPCLKTKKHWNSFTSEFFVSSKIIIENLKEKGEILLPPKSKCKEYMDLPLKCHKCQVKPKNMPELKNHIMMHT